MFRSLASTWYGFIVAAAALHGCDGQAATDSGVPDSACTPSTFYADADGDGYGDVARGTTACTAPAGTVADATDCDDTDAGSFPGAVEVCGDGLDQDCDGPDVECPRVDVLSMPNYIVGTTEFHGIGAPLTALNGGTSLVSDGVGTTDESLWVWSGPVEGEQEVSAAAQPWVGWVGEMAAVGPPDTLAVRTYDGLVLYDDRSADPYLSDSFRGNGVLANSGDWYAPTALEVGDLTDDGVPDLAYSWFWLDNENPDHSAQTLLVVSSDGEGDLGDGDEAVRIDGVGRSLAVVGDTDGDGVDDLLTSSGYDHEWYLFRGPLGGAVPSDAADIVARVDDALLAEAIGDVDGDGLGDVAMISASAEGPLPIYALAGAEPFTSPVAELDFNANRVWGGFDVNGDGWNDIAVSWGGLDGSSATPTDGVWLVPGPFAGLLDVATDGRILSTGANAAESVTAVDLDNDGAMELAVGMSVFGEETAGNGGDRRGAVFVLSQDQLNP